MNFEDFCASAISSYQLEALELEKWERIASTAFQYFEEDGNRATTIEELAKVSDRPTRNLSVYLDVEFDVKKYPCRRCCAGDESSTCSLLNPSRLDQNFGQKTQLLWLHQVSTWRDDTQYTPPTPVLIGHEIIAFVIGCLIIAFLHRLDCLLCCLHTSIALLDLIYFTLFFLPLFSVAVER